MQIGKDSLPDGMVVRLSGEIDHHRARELREQLDMMVEKQRPPHLQLDFGGVGFMDSSGIGLIMGRYRLMKLYGGRLTVTGMSARLRRVAELAGLDKLGVLQPGEAAEREEKQA